MNCTYRLILTVLQRGTMVVGNNGEGVHNVILDAGNGGVGVRGIMADGRSGWVCVYCEFLLGAGS